MFDCFCCAVGAATGTVLINNGQNTAPSVPWPARPAAPGVLPAGMTTLVVAMHVILAALVILAVILATTRQTVSWQMQSAAATMYAAAYGNVVNAMHNAMHNL